MLHAVHESADGLCHKPGFDVSLGSGLRLLGFRPDAPSVRPSRPKPCSAFKLLPAACAPELSLQSRLPARCRKHVFSAMIASVVV